MSEFVSDTSKIKNSTYGKNIHIYRNVWLNDTNCGDNVSIGDDSIVERCNIGNNVTINRRCYVNDATIDDFCFVGINTLVRPSVIGKFCEISQNVDIGGRTHDYKKITTMTKEWFNNLLNVGKRAHFNPPKEFCKIGNDVWIAAGARVLSHVTVGDGAIIGAGAVVTKDVPPYAIVAGVPAKIIKYRFTDKIIEELLKIKWWNFPRQVIIDNFENFMARDVDEEMIEKLKEMVASFTEEKS